MITHHNIVNDVVDDDVAENWSFSDDDILSESDKNFEDLSSTGELMAKPAAPRSQSLFRDLENYLRYLSTPESTIPHLHGILQKESLKNDTPLSLLNYYKSRPQLTSYTLETELDRLSYTIKDKNQFIKDKSLIRQRYSSSQNAPEIDLLFRAANQSLLADAIQSLTRTEALIRPQFHVTALATECDFLIDVTKLEVRCNCRLKLSIPLSDDDRWDMGGVTLRVVFSPVAAHPRWETDILELDVRKCDEATLARVVSALARSTGGELELCDTGRVMERDDVVVSYASGMSGALKQVDAVVNVSSKFNFFKGLGSSLLPSADLIARAEEEQVGIGAGGRDVVMVSRESCELPPRSSSPPRQIIGGLLMKNLSKLAVAAAQPEKEADLKLYKKEEELEEAMVRFYNKTDDTSNAQMSPPLQPPKEDQKTIDHQPTKITEDDDGWSDDDIELSDTEVETHNNVDHRGVATIMSRLKEEMSTAVVIVPEDAKREDIVETRTRWSRPFRNRVRF